ncbi:Phenylserine dehydratase [Pseudovibrio axinellae]|uniref:Phenylserine dehydratase n=1 Tax=Pseudovibrio axinellae TaxID=989403 RepID=A0A166A5Y9_9HYPH|nr:threonine/serine dehydratase [Pseudovibrio axinellae]KZL20656.1 Phenylserine dehydratase [Pseudovibrio axinellae]SER26639.1 L-threonine ammonia-lyase [Pseudovibrio axinellae]
MYISKQEIENAHQRIQKYIRKTPSIISGFGTFGLKRSISLKLEHLQHSGSFKARGAFNSLLNCTVPKAGVAAASGGNHGAAVACAAHALGIKAKIFVPEISNPAKIDKIRSFGADVHIEGAAYADAAAICTKFQQQTGAIDIHPYDAVNTINGQGTVALEWAEQNPDMDTILVAVGGGGLAAGVASFYAGTSTRVIAIEPYGSCSMHAALKAGRPVDVELNSVAANALGAKCCGTRPFEIASKHIAKSVLVEDEAILAAQRRLWREMQLVVEPGGATALAALISGAYKPEDGERIGVLLCGGNAELIQVNNTLSGR